MTDDDKAQNWCSPELPCARYEDLSAENERLRRDHAALAKQLDIAQRKLKGVTKQWYSARAALGGTK